MRKVKHKDPRMMVKYKDLRVRDVVRCSTGPFLDAVVTKITPQMVTLFRPYIHFSDNDRRDDIAKPYIGIEEFVVFRSDVEIEVLRRDDEAIVQDPKNP
jgi:hypothetical protein